MSTFYDEIGGGPTIRAIVKRFYEGVARDEVLRPLYPEASSFSMLGSGLTLALLPSLLLALDEPVSVRGALIGAAGVLVLAAGMQQRLAAPFLLGALTTGILAVRHLEPVADAVPRWISLGGVGLVLLIVGVTWEARQRNLEQAHRYLTALR